MNKLTLVLTSFNRINLLKSMIQSLQIQSDKSYDLIVCDNCSTDGSFGYIESLNKFNNGEFIKLNWDKNLGWAGSAERWRKYIKTDWVTIVCDDDWVSIDFVKVINSEINSANDFNGLIALGHARINNELNFIKEYNYGRKHLSIKNAINDFYHQKFDVAGISGFALKSSILKTEFPKYYEGNGFLEDTLIIYRALISGGVRFVPGIYYFRLEHSGSIASSNRRILNYRLALLRFTKDLKEISLVANLDEKLIRKITPYNMFWHFKGLMREVVINKMSLNLFKEYIKKSKNINKYKHYEALVFYPIISVAIYFRNFKTLFKFNR